MRHIDTQNQTPFLLQLMTPLLLLIGSMAFASTDDIQQPIHIEADQAEIHERQGVMTYSGHVILKQGGIEMRADTVVVYSKEGELQRVTAEGQPVHYLQRPLHENDAIKEIKGVSQRMEYRAKDKRLLLLGNAEFWQGENRFSGNRIQYDPESQRVLASAGDADAGISDSDGNGAASQPGEKPPRVTVTIQPKKKISVESDTVKQGQPAQ